MKNNKPVILTGDESEWKRVKEWDNVKLNYGYQKVEIDLTTTEREVLPVLL